MEHMQPFNACLCPCVADISASTVSRHTVNLNSRDEVRFVRASCCPGVNLFSSHSVLPMNVACCIVCVASCWSRFDFIGHGLVIFSALLFVSAVSSPHYVCVSAFIHFGITTRIIDGVETYITCPESDCKSLPD